MVVAVVLLFMLCLLLCCLLYSSMGNFWVVSLFLYDYTSRLVIPSFISCTQSNGLHFIAGFCNFVFHFGVLLSFLFGHSLFFFTHLLVFLIVSPTSCMIAFCCSYLFFSVRCCLFYEFIVSSSSCHLSFVVVLGNCFFI